MILVEDLRLHGVTLELKGDRLHYRGPADVLTLEMRQHLADRKEAVLAYLHQQANESPISGDIVWAEELLPERGRSSTACPCCGRDSWWVDSWGIPKCSVCHPMPAP